MPRAVVFAACVLLGELLAESLLPLRAPTAAIPALLAGAAARLASPAFPAAAAGLGLVRAARADEDFRARATRAAARYEGVFDVEREEGTGWIVRASDRRWSVADAPAGFPSPGRRGRALLRLDPIRGRAEPSAFQAERWAAARGLHGRARVLGTVEDLGPAPGLVAAARRLGFRFRETARARLGFGSSAGGNLATALLLGDRRALDPTVQADFRRAGLSHVLALSGAHLAVLALGLATLLHIARVPRSAARLAVLAFVTGYTVVTGAAPPLVRACATVLLATAAALLGRRSDAASSLAWATGGLLLVFPAWRHDIGFRLSVLATAILVLFARQPRPAPRAVPAALVNLGESIRLSVLVTLATLPELAASFGLFSIQGPLANVLAALPSAAALGWSALAVFLPWPEGVAARLADAGVRACDVLIALLRMSAACPGGDLRLAALSWPAGGVILMVTTRLACGGRPGRAESRLLVSLLLAAAWSAWPRERVTFLDVGQGDAVLLEAGGNAVLVDAGPPGHEGRESAASAAVRRRRMRPLDAIVVTHGHLDHLGGAPDLLARRAVRRLVTRGGGERPDALIRLEESAPAARCSVQRPGHIPFLGGRFAVRDPRAGDEPPRPIDENDRSLAATFRTRSFSVMLLGDGGPGPHAALAAARFLEPASVLLLPHHGSRDATDPALLARVRPRLVIASCGDGNPHGHPHAETLALASRARAALLRTDRDGTVTLTATRRGLRIRWIRGFPGPAPGGRGPIPLPAPANIP